MICYKQSDKQNFYIFTGTIPVPISPEFFSPLLTLEYKFSLRGMAGTNPKTTLYVGGLEENVDEAIVHAAFIPFGDIKDVNIPLDQSNQKNRGFGFVTFLEKGDAAAAMDNLHNAELYGKVLTCNYAQPVKIKGGEQGWASQPVWADADTWFERQQQEEEIQKLQTEHDATVAEVDAATKHALAKAAQRAEKETEEVMRDDPMAQAEAIALSGNGL